MAARVTQLAKSLVFVFLQSLILTAVVGEHVMFDNNRYMLDYEVKGDKIEFKIQVSNCTGWVGLGINTNGGMAGADFFIGGVLNGGEYHGDYYVPAGEGNKRPTRDAKQDWEVIEFKEEKNNTMIKFTRALNTNDNDQDKVIENKKQYLLWSYHIDNDDPTTSNKHTERGAQEINFFGNTGSSLTTGGLFMILVTACITMLHQ